MHMHHDHVGGGTDIKEEERAICPVMHIPVSKHEAEENGLVSTFEGKQYHMCCKTCIGMFERDPERYAHAAEEDV